MYAFSYLIGNGDLHAKNISLQTEPKTKRVQLTPAYDLICTYLYKDRHMALKLDGRDANIKRAHIVSFAARWGLQEKAIHHMLDKLLKSFTQNLNLLYEIPMPEKEKTLIASMAHARIADLG